MDADASVLDRIYDMVGDCLQAKDFSTVDTWLQLVMERTKYTPTDNLLAYLTTTLPAADSLKNRITFFRWVEKALEMRGHLGNRILQGLE